MKSLAGAGYRTRSMAAASYIDLPQRYLFDAPQLADQHAMGKPLRCTTQNVHMSAYTLGHTCTK